MLSWLTNISKTFKEEIGKHRTIPNLIEHIKANNCENNGKELRSTVNDIEEQDTILVGMNELEEQDTMFPGIEEQEEQDTSYSKADDQEMNISIKEFENVDMETIDGVPEVEDLESSIFPSNSTQLAQNISWVIERGAKVFRDISATLPASQSIHDATANVFEVLCRKAVRNIGDKGIEVVYGYNEREERGLKHCKLCSKQVRLLRLSVLLRHICSHDRHANRWKCPNYNCDYSEYDLQTVRRHIQNAHKSEENPIDRRALTDVNSRWLKLTAQCFPEEVDRVKKHIADMSKTIKKRPKAVDSERKSNTCLLCSQSIRSNITSLFTHLGNHCDEKRYECATCSTQFSNQGHVKVHIQKRHGGRGDFILKASDELDDAWKRAALQCFPNEADKLCGYIKRKSEVRKRAQHAAKLQQQSFSDTMHTTQAVASASESLTLQQQSHFHPNPNNLQQENDSDQMIYMAL